MTQGEWFILPSTVPFLTRSSVNDFYPQKMLRRPEGTNKMGIQLFSCRIKASSPPYWIELWVFKWAVLSKTGWKGTVPCARGQGLLQLGSATHICIFLFIPRQGLGMFYHLLALNHIWSVRLACSIALPVILDWWPSMIFVSSGSR